MLEREPFLTRGRVPNQDRPVSPLHSRRSREQFLG
jgi:hypothetical protein